MIIFKALALSPVFIKYTELCLSNFIPSNLDLSQHYYQVTVLS